MVGQEIQNYLGPDLWLLRFTRTLSHTSHKGWTAKAGMNPLEPTHACTPCVQVSQVARNMGMRMTMRRFTFIRRAAGNS